MAEHGLLEHMRALARQPGREAGTPLVWEHTFPARPGARISHLPISQRLSQTWVTLTGGPFRPHQALALSALRRGEPFVLLGDHTTTRETLHLLLYEVLRDQRPHRALLLLPDADSALLHQAALNGLGQHVPQPLEVVLVDGDTPAREAARAQILLTTPDVLHRRLLRYHDRAWQPVWHNLRYLLLGHIERYSGVAAAHLAGLLLRASRLIRTSQPPILAATALPVQDATDTLDRLSGMSWRAIDVNDTPLPATALLLWQAGHERLSEAARLALAAHQLGSEAHLLCSELDELPLLLHIGPDTTGVSLGALTQPAPVHICAGYPESAVDVYHAVNSGAELTLLVLGTTPLERTLLRLPALLQRETLPICVAAPTNAYVIARHLLCAASERPLSSAEIDAWQAGDMIARLERQHRLVHLPDDGAAWQPLPATDDPYAHFDVWAVDSAAALISDEQGRWLASLDADAFDRWGFPGAALPPLRGGYRVIARDDDTSTLVVREEKSRRTTLPLRQCEVHVRDERATRLVNGRVVSWGPVLIEETIVGYRATQPGSQPGEHTLDTTLHTRWTAPALWIDLPLRLRASGQLIGWSLVAALPLHVLCRATDSVPAYDAGLSRLYIIDAQPGGNGLAAWLATNLEKVLPLAYDIALDSRNDALFEPVARLDMDWLLSLLGGQVEQPHVQQRTRAAPAAQPAHPAAAPEPAPPEPAEPAPQRKRSRARKAAPQPAEAPPKSRRTGRSETPTEDQPAPRRKRKPAVPPEPAAPEPAASPEPAAPKPAAPPEPAAPEPAAPPEPTPPDADAILTRLQQLRSKQEARQNQPTRRKTSPPASPPSEPRFQPGERVLCLPYGEGVVASSTLADDGHEQVQVDFPDYGCIELNPSVNQVRRLPSTPDADPWDA